MEGLVVFEKFKNFFWQKEISQEVSGYEFNVLQILFGEFSSLKSPMNWLPKSGRITYPYNNS